jgi:hypothetical protein
MVGICNLQMEFDFRSMVGPNGMIKAAGVGVGMIEPISDEEKRQEAELEASAGRLLRKTLAILTGWPTVFGPKPKLKVCRWSSFSGCLPLKKAREPAP